MLRLVLISLLSCWLVACSQGPDDPFSGALPISRPDVEMGDDRDMDRITMTFCTPGERRCLEENSPLIEVCDDDATQWRLDSCETGHVCRDAQCVPFACVPGRATCAGRDAAGRCSPNGRALEGVSPCSQGDVCSGGRCVDLCTLAAQSASYIGCDYTALRLFNYYEEGADRYGAPYAIIAANPHRFLDTSVSITLSDGSFARLIRESTLRPDSTYTFAEATTVVSTILTPNGEENMAGGEAREVVIPPRSAGVFLIDWEEGRGPFSVRSSHPIVAYQFSPYCCNFTASNDASLLLPTPTLGTRYRVVGYPSMEFDEAVGAATLSPYIAIAATDLAARVTITSATPLIHGGDTYALVPTPAQIAQASTTHEISLRPRERAIFSLPDSPSSTTASTLTGVEVSSTVPVAVFSGHPCTFVPQDQWACDHLEEQLAPASTFGERYVLPAVRHRNRIFDGGREGVYWIIVADEDATIRTDPPLSALKAFEASSAALTSCLDMTQDESIVLEAGQSCELGLGASASLQSDGVVEIAGIISGHQSTGLLNYGTQAGDPAMFSLPPVEQFRRDYTFATPPTFKRTFAAILAPQDATLTYGGEFIPPASRVQHEEVVLGETRFSIFHLRLDSGVHTIEANRPFGLIVYAYDDYVSYAFPAGLDLTPRIKE